MAANAAQLAKKLTALAGSMQEGRRTSVMDAALVAKDTFNDGLRHVGVHPGTGRLRIGAAFNIKGTSNPTALVSYKGPAHWFEYGTKDHVVVSKKLGGSRQSRTQLVPGEGMFAAKSTKRRGVRRRGAVMTPAGPRAYAKVRGMRRRPFWQNTKRLTAQRATNTLREGLRRNIFHAGFGK